MRPIVVRCEGTAGLPNKLGRQRALRAAAYSGPAGPRPLRARSSGRLAARWSGDPPRRRTPATTVAPQLNPIGRLTSTPFSGWSRIGTFGCAGQKRPDRLP